MRWAEMHCKYMRTAYKAIKVPCMQTIIMCQPVKPSATYAHINGTTTQTEYVAAT